MSCRRSGSETALPWENHIALVSLQGWNSRRLEGGGEPRRGGRENKIIFIPQYGTARSNPEPPGRGVHRAQLNSRRSLRRRQFVLAVSRLSWLSQGEPGSWPRAGGSHLRKLSHAHMAHWTGRQIYRDALRRCSATASLINDGERGRQNEREKNTKRRKVMSPSGVTNCRHQGFLFLIFCFVLCLRSVRNSP